MRKTVLIVDDQDEVIRVLRETLERDGWQVHETREIKEAWALLERLEDKPGVAILDLNVSEPNDGMELGRKVKAAFPAIKIVILSGYFKDEARYPNEFYYLDKPFKLSEVIILCNGLLNPPGGATV